MIKLKNLRKHEKSLVCHKMHPQSITLFSPIPNRIRRPMKHTNISHLFNAPAYLRKYIANETKIMKMKMKMYEMIFIWIED